MKYIDYRPGATYAIDEDLKKYFRDMYPYNLALYALNLPRTRDTSAFFDQFPEDNVGLSRICPAKVMRRINEMDKSDREYILEHFAFGVPFNLMAKDICVHPATISARTRKIVQKLILDGVIFDYVDGDKPRIKDLVLTGHEVMVLRRALRDVKGVLIMPLKDASELLTKEVLFSKALCGDGPAHNIVQQFEAHGFPLKGGEDADSSR